MQPTEVEKGPPGYRVILISTTKPVPKGKSLGQVIHFTLPIAITMTWIHMKNFLNPPLQAINTCWSHDSLTDSTKLVVLDLHLSTMARGDPGKSVLSKISNGAYGSWIGTASNLASARLLSKEKKGE